MNFSIESLLLAIIGVVVGAAFSFTYAKRQQKGADKKSETLIREAEKKAEKLVNQAESDAEKRRASLLKESEERQVFLRELEKSLQQREATLDKRLQEIEKSRLDWEKKNTEVLQIKEAVREIREKQEASLERI